MVNEIRVLEESLLRNDIRNSSVELEKLLSPDFQEHGSSGDVYKYKAGDLFGDRNVSRYQISDFRTVHLETNILLALYTIELEFEGEKPYKSIRSSVWKKENNQWKLYFHQGTKTGK